MVHTPPQQSGPDEHASPSCVQNDEASEQVPPAQSCEQQSVFCMHALPAVLHEVLSGVHVPLHLPPQHCASLVHAELSERHACPLHWPPTHESEQHWSGDVHAEPDASQLTGEPPRHVCFVGSHCAEQQSASPVHAAPFTPHLRTPPSTTPPLLLPTLPSGWSPALPDCPPHPPAVVKAAATTVSTAIT
jgi:hypothetical protein